MNEEENVMKQEQKKLEKADSVALRITETLPLEGSQFEMAKQKRFIHREPTATPPPS